MGSKHPTTLPADIVERIKNDFAQSDEVQAVIQYVDDLHFDSSRINVGPSQYCRAILVLAAGNFERFNNLTSAPDDPRDIIMKAESKLGRPRHYFIPPFDEQA